jgi:hypothetical protein
LDASNRLELLKGNVIQALYDALVAELHLEVQVDLVGALHNLASSGGDDICQELVRKSLLPILLAMIPKVRLSYFR